MSGAFYGDTRHVILIPHDTNSCFDFARRSFDFADRFQTPVFVAMDLDLGMNLWLSEPLKLQREPFDLGKRLAAEQLEEWTKDGKKFRRYFSSYEPVREARDRLKTRGLRTNHMLIRALPLTSEVRDFLAEHDTIYLVEQNRDAQMAAIIKDEHPDLGAKIVSVLIYNGLPATPLEVVNQIFAAAQSTERKTAQM